MIKLTKLAIFILALCAGTGSLFPYGLSISAREVEKAPAIDGCLDDEAWDQTKPFTNFKMVKPDTGEPSEKTELRVLYDQKNLYIGVYCFTMDPSTIAVTNLTHDQRGYANDTVKILLDPFQDKRNAYVFFVNPKGARTDGLATGEHFSTNWDGIWDAASKIQKNGWSTELKIPFKTISFNPRLEEWGFNVERYIPYKMEVIRLSGLSKDSFFYNPAEAALLDGIGNIKQGKGITLKPHVALDMSQDYENLQERKWDLPWGFDLYKNFTPNLVGVFTYHTDFAETEVDERQINLTRFSLYFPEKRAFFLEGSEIFNFEGGGGRRPSFMPFFSRNIGLYDEDPIPIDWGVKIYGKIGKTNLSLLDVKAKAFNDIPRKNFFAGRISQNIFSQSKLGIIFTSGEPGPESFNNKLFGMDFKYATSHFLKNKNFSFSGWWVYNWNQYTEGKHYGYGLKVDYPNDLFDIGLSYNYFGDSLEPGLGFLPRGSGQQLRTNFQFRPRPKNGLPGKLIRQLFFRVFGFFYWDLQGNIESSRISICPLTHIRAESGDQIEFYIIPQREVLTEPFEVAENFFIPIGDYSFTRYQVEFRSASHRMIQLNLEYEFGGFYGGKLRQIELGLDFKYRGNISLGLQGNFVRGNLPEGKLDENLYRLKADFYLNPNIGLMTFIQYDSVSGNIGANFRFKWRISPGNTIYLVYNKSWEKLDPLSRFMPLQDRGIFKIQLSWRP
jgi:hypothetical protein